MNMSLNAYSRQYRPLRPDTAQVQAAFDRAALTYDAAAVVQRQAAQGLLAHLLAYADALNIPLPLSAPVLDAGCGTGYALPLLAQHCPGQPLLALDVAPAMLRSSQHVLRGLQSTVPSLCATVCADLHALPLVAASLGLYWSSLALQWCHVPTALTEARRVLRPQALLAAATLGPGTLAELAKAFAYVDTHRHVLAFDDAACIGAALTDAGLVDVQLHRASFTLHYPHLRDVLAAIKSVGANRVGPAGRSPWLGRTGLLRLEQAYECLRTPAGLPLSYEVIYMLARAGA